MHDDARWPNNPHAKHSPLKYAEFTEFEVRGFEKLFDVEKLFEVRFGLGVSRFSNARPLKTALDESAGY